MADKHSIIKDVANVLRGLCMGAADIVPGVSGGTVALLLGIYPRLLTAISHVDGTLFGLLKSAKWREAAEYLDLRFLLTLVLGIGSSVLLLSGVIHHLLDEYPELTMSVFFGLILASGILVLRLVGPKTPAQQTQCVIMAIIGACLATWLVLGGYLQPQDNLLYVFGCGAVGICAMILPGISGSYILLLLGKYHQIIEIVHHLKAGQLTRDELTTLVVFASGCLIGLLVFSKILKALLSRFYVPTISLLGGFMLGSLAKIWPWQNQVADAPEGITRPDWPAEFNTQVIYCLALAVGSFAFVLVADYLAQNRKSAKG
ncbi:DUF368 domain-containing protein [Aeoliella mucimassa]|uniref:DUF368 domain-containing protein n=1 Tax=Aeoliella mucimassa TaxID=2527972 RepID=A0A518AW93_9BACT|nr:DUF368 domain-containing protein [Aeoliella mucimassa]QDU58976.1 hypothetical protein Pan181_52170 [Aeoliella mucimassa]